MSTSIEPSLARLAKKAKSRSSEDEGKIVVAFPAKGSAYSDPSFVNEVTEGLLLPTDRRRLNEIGPVKTAEWSLAHSYQVCRLRSHLCLCICFGEFLSVDCGFAGSDRAELAEGVDHTPGEEEQ